MPQSAAAVQDPNYTPIDPQKDFLGFVIANKEAIQRMPEDKQLRFVDMLFRRFALPKYQKVNQQRPLDVEEVDRLRTQFAARIFGIPVDNKTELKEEKTEPGILKKGAAALEGAGAGVLGGIRTMYELHQKLEKHLGPAKYLVDPVGSLTAKPLGKVAGKAEGKAYEDAQSVSPNVASISAGVGHQIPAAIATHGVESILPAAGKGASLGLRALSGAGRGAAGGATYEATRPGGDPVAGAEWGGVLGAAFPFLGKIFGLGRRTATKAAEAASAGEKATPAAGAAPQAAETSTSLGDVANKVAKEKFGKPFKDLSSAEKAQMPSIMKEEIKKQAAQKAATKKAEGAAAKAGREAEETAKRAAKAKEATEKAAQQAAKRSATGTSPKATAAKAAEENPQAAVPSGFKQGEGTAANAPGQTIKTNISQEIESGKHELEKAKSILKNPSASAEEKKIAKDNYIFWSEKLGLRHPFEGEAKPVVTKVPKGVEGKKVRAKGGAPASPAQQKADAERIAAKRAEAKSETFGAALEKHAQEMAGRHTSASLGIMHVPELEGAVKEMPNGEYMLKTLQKAKRAYKWSDEIYAESLKEWLLNQFASEGKP